ncbi:MAG: hypothetical protein L0I24_17605 [Pseudonocardia sp.]|nr:hypothetical protein [Pseudonocardia sp.]
MISGVQVGRVGGEDEPGDPACGAARGPEPGEGVGEVRAQDRVVQRHVGFGREAAEGPGLGQVQPGDRGDLVAVVFDEHGVGQHPAAETSAPARSRR